MAKILSKTGISSGSIVQPGHVTQSIDAFTGIEAYDITLSGSLIVTGSVILDTNINKNFQGTASNTPLSSSYALTGFSSSYALTTQYADNETIVLSLYSYHVLLTSGSTNFIGVGNYSTSSADSIGLAYIEGNGTILSAMVASNVLSTTGSLQSDVSLYINSTPTTFLNKLTYLTGSQFVRQDINQPVTQGDKIYIRLDTNSGTQPTRVIHNINLHIKRNG
jgi:hypothetical protein